MSVFCKCIKTDAGVDGAFTKGQKYEVSEELFLKLEEEGVLANLRQAAEPIESAESAELAESAEPVEPVEPVEPAEPVEPVEPQEEAKETSLVKKAKTKIEKAVKFGE